MLTPVLNRWRLLDPPWRLAITVFLVARIALSAWAFIVSAFIPLAVSNLVLHGESVVTVFDLRTSDRAVLSRLVEGQELHFRAAYPNVVDSETSSTWDLSGRALSGPLLGAQLSRSSFSVEEVFPYHQVAPSQDLLFALYQRFDANWFLKIAERGYSDDGSTVYLPLYPILIKVVGSWILRDALPGAILVSNLALLGSLVLFLKAASEIVDAPSAHRALAFFLVFPSAFFLLAPYTESLFLLLVLASYQEARLTHWGRAGLWAACAALTRLQGVLLLVPLAHMAWREYRTSGRGLAHGVLRFSPLVLPSLATISYLGFSNLSLFNAYESRMHAQFVMPWDNIGAAVAVIANARASPIDILNLLVTLFLGALIILGWNHLPRELGLYSVVMFLAPIFRMTTEQPLVSMVRYALAIFPIFILLGKWSRGGWAQRAVVYLSIPLQLFLSAQFFLWGWVG